MKIKQKEEINTLPSLHSLDHGWQVHFWAKSHYSLATVSLSSIVSISNCPGQAVFLGAAVMLYTLGALGPLRRRVTERAYGGASVVWHFFLGRLNTSANFSQIGNWWKTEVTLHLRYGLVNYWLYWHYLKEKRWIKDSCFLEHPPTMGDSSWKLELWVSCAICRQLNKKDSLFQGSSADLILLSHPYCLNDLGEWVGYASVQFQGLP